MSNFSIHTALLAFVLGAAMTAPLAAHAAEQADNETTFAALASDSELSESRGAWVPNTVNLNTAELTAQDNHNVVIGGVTGGNSVNGSFNGSSGLVNVIQNSGNNVIIQSSTIVNMTFNK